MAVVMNLAPRPDRQKKEHISEASLVQGSHLNFEREINIENRSKLPTGENLSFNRVSIPHEPTSENIELISATKGIFNSPEIGTIDISRNPEMSGFFENSAEEFQRRSEVLLRAPSEEELGKKFISYIKTESGYTESETHELSESDIIQKTMDVIGHDESGMAVYGETVIDSCEAENEFGTGPIRALGNKPGFSRFKRNQSVIAAPACEAFELAGEKGGSAMFIFGTSKEAAKEVFRSDYITTCGRVISEEEMRGFTPVKECKQKSNKFDSMDNSFSL